MKFFSTIFNVLWQIPENSSIDGLVDQSTTIERDLEGEGHRLVFREVVTPIDRERFGGREIQTYFEGGSDSHRQREIWRERDTKVF